jgi:hypothetical protein
MQIKKQRNGLVGTKLAYKWSANIGEFINIPINQESSSNTEKSEPKSRKKHVENSKEDVF